MLKLYIKTLGKEFYLQHTGLLLFIFYIVFGAVEPGQMVTYQQTLIISICSSPISLSIFLLILSIYTLKCYWFINQKLALPIYQFIIISCSVNKKEQIKNWAVLYAVIGQPVLVYVAIFACVGIIYSFYWSILIVITYYLMLLIGAAFFTYRSVNLRYIYRKKFVAIDLRKTNKPFWSWPLYYLLKSQTIMLIVCKILSFILFKGIIWMFADANQDRRVGLIAILAVIITHSVIISTVLKYERTQLSFLNSLPVSNGKRMLTRLFFLSCLFTPELLFYISYSSNSIYSILTGLMFCISGAFTLMMSIYFFDNDTELNPTFVFLFFIVSMLVILYQQILIFSLLLLIITTIYHHQLFYKSKL